MKKIVTIVSCLLITLWVTGQDDKDKMMKMVQEQLKKYTNDTNALKMVKGAMEQQKKTSNPAENKTNNNAGQVNTATYDPGEYGSVDNWKFPAKDAAKLAAIPKKVFTKTELISYLADLYTQLSQKVSPGVAGSVQALAARYQDDANKMGAVAVSGWYSDYREEGLLLITKAALTSPGNKLVLNNCAAILNLSGIEFKAVPLLRYLLQDNPGDPVILNNLGQAWAGLGETDSAMSYLGRCLKADPDNIEANNTCGQIEAVKGHTAQAVGYFEKSIKNGYTTPALLKLKRIKPETKIAPLVRPRIHLPEYFNEFKYKLPAQCTSTGNAVQAAAEHEAFRAEIDRQVKKYGGELSQLALKVQGMAAYPPKFAKDDFAAQPYKELCSIMAGEVKSEFENGIAQYDKKFFDDWGNLNGEYQDKYRAIQASGTCEERNALANKYLPKFAMLMEDWQEKNQAYFNKYFDEVIYWEYLSQHCLGNDYFLMNSYYPMVLQYLGMLGKVGKTMIILPCVYTETTATADSLAEKEFECPIEISVPFFIGKFKFDCDKITFSCGEGALFSYSKNFKTKQSTLRVGIGWQPFEFGKGFGPISGSIGANLNESLFISFDGNNKISDAGLTFSAGISTGIEGEAEKSLGDRAIKATHDIKGDITKNIDPDIKKYDDLTVGYTIAVVSGLNFNEGPFKDWLKPKTVQLNKNVKMYNNDQ